MKSLLARIAALGFTGELPRPPENSYANA